MDLTLETIPIPLHDDGHGGLRVGRTRVSLESVWHMHQQGASAAEIVRAFDTLQLADVHAVLAHADALGREQHQRPEPYLAEDRVRSGGQPGRRSAVQHQVPE